MSGKQMEGDNTQRRARARQAREQGIAPSAAEVTLGASKQREHEGRHDDHDDKMAARDQGKR
ncbi:MAG: hypothetical protein ACTHNT_10940 [Actinomycetales bacterium]